MDVFLCIPRLSCSNHVYKIWINGNQKYIRSERHSPIRTAYPFVGIFLGVFNTAIENQIRPLGASTMNQALTAFRSCPPGGLEAPQRVQYRRMSPSSLTSTLKRRVATSHCLCIVQRSHIVSLSSNHLLQMHASNEPISSRLLLGAEVSHNSPISFSVMHLPRRCVWCRLCHRTV